MSSILHLVRKSAFETSDFQQCLAVIGTNDALVLLDDGCYNVKHPSFTNIDSIIPLSKIYVIGHHSSARNVTMPEGIAKISLTDLVSLVATNDKTITWQ